jgi:N-acetyl-anhydromuramyl-L-alanine amidase AmpD
MRARFAVLASLAVVACSASRPSGEASASDSGPLAKTFAASAESNGVPRDLMVAISVVEGRLDMPATRDVEPEAAVQAAGPMQLRHGKFDSLARGAQLIGVTELDLRRDSDLAIEAGARVLAEVGARLGASDDLGSWSAAVEEVSGYADDAHRHEYAHRVFALLARGGTFPGRDGEPITLPQHDLPPNLTLDLSETLHVESSTPDYPGAQWIPTSCVNKCDSGRGGASIGYVVIHDTEESWDASISTLQNKAYVSVQYLVGQDGKVAQFVHEADTAWHDGNYYYNQRSVGIEHVGYYNQAYPEAEYVASAKLVQHLTDKYNVPKDRMHVVGHDQVPNPNPTGGTTGICPSPGFGIESAAICSKAPGSCETGSQYGGNCNHRDPGDWEWATYMPRFGGDAKCNDVTNLWNCSNDKKQIFRCSGGTVQVKACSGGCVPQANGVDDICNTAPPPNDAGSAPPPPPPPPPAPSSSSPPVASDTPPTPSPSGDPQAPDTSPVAADSGGCSAAPRAHSSDDRLGWALMLGVGFFAARRRERRARK